MSAPVIGLTGTALGATAVLLGAVISARLQARHDRERWQRDRVQAAYDGAIRSLLHALNHRGEWDKGPAPTDRYHLWIEDLIDAQFWLHTLLSTSNGAQHDRIDQAAARVDRLLEDFAFHASTSADDTDTLRTTIRTVSQCAQEELHGTGRGA